MSIDTTLDRTAQEEVPAAVAEPAPVLDTGTEVTFASLDLPAPLVRTLTEAGVNTAFPIQAATIPDALVGRDVLGRGQTGSGKTLAFGLPTLARLEGLRAKPRRPLALVLVPTRELAMQVEEALKPYARSMHLRIRAVYGGAPMRKQIDGLRYGTEILVATPGRLSDLIERGECELQDVDMAILDEADQMCDMGFLPHVCELMDQVAEGGQRLLFSASLDGAVDEIVSKYMNEPVLHEVDPMQGSVTTMTHHLLMVTPQHKAKVAAQIAARHAAEAGKPDARTIFFVRTQMAVDRVTEQLRERGLPAAGLHGGMTQMARTKTLEDFKEGLTPVLIATDVAARGIHVDGVDLVVHIDPPRDSKDYLHRAGRTARAGQSGVVASLVLPKQRKQAQRMMNDAGVTADEVETAPVGTSGKFGSGAVALAELTGAREVPEPGEVAVFTLPVRERPRFEDRGRRGGFGDRGGYGDRGQGGRPQGGRDFRRDDRFNRDDRRPAYNRDAAGAARPSGGFNRDAAAAGRPAGGFNRDAAGGTRPSGGFDRGTSERPTGGFDRDRRTFDRAPSREARPFERREPRPFPRRDDRRDGSFDRNRGTGGGFGDRYARPNRDDRSGSVPQPRRDRDETNGAPRD